jgi:hypothetical protein
MRLKQPRIAPLSPAEWDGETREVLEGLAEDGHVYNFRDAGAASEAF